MEVVSNQFGCDKATGLHISGQTASLTFSIEFGSSTNWYIVGNYFARSGCKNSAHHSLTFITISQYSKHSFSCITTAQVLYLFQNAGTVTDITINQNIFFECPTPSVTVNDNPPQIIFLDTG